MNTINEPFKNCKQKECTCLITILEVSYRIQPGKHFFLVNLNCGNNLTKRPGDSYILNRLLSSFIVLLIIRVRKLEPVKFITVIIIIIKLCYDQLWKERAPNSLNE